MLLATERGTDGSVGDHRSIAEPAQRPGFPQRVSEEAKEEIEPKFLILILVIMSEIQETTFVICRICEQKVHAHLTPDRR